MVAKNIAKYFFHNVGFRSALVGFWVSLICINNLSVKVIETTISNNLNSERI